MPDDPFRPLTVETRPGQYRTLWTVEDAAGHLLSKEWPAGNHGKTKHLALRACLEALEGKGTAEQARKCFLEAAFEAGVFVREGEWKRLT